MTDNNTPFVPNAAQKAEARNETVALWRLNRAERRERIRAQRERAGVWVPEKRV